MEKIVDRRKEGRKIFYQVKWEGFPVEQNTWEPVKNLTNVRDMIKLFN